MIVELASLIAALAASDDNDDTVDATAQGLGLGGRGGGGGAPPTFEDQVIELFLGNLMETAASFVKPTEEAEPHLFLFRKTPQGELELHIAPLLMHKDHWPTVFTAAVIQSGAYAYAYIGETWMTLVETGKRRETIMGLLCLARETRSYIREISTDRKTVGPIEEMPRGAFTTRFPSMQDIAVTANSYTARRKAMKAPKVWN